MIHPKVKASVSAAVIAGAVVAVLGQFGINAAPNLVSAVEVIVVAVAGYVAPGVISE